MFGFLNFFIRLGKPLLIFAGLVLLTGGLAYFGRYASQFLWESFEQNFYDQAQWVKERLDFFRPWKFWTMGCAVVVSTLVFLVIVLLASSGTGSGNLLP